MTEVKSRGAALAERLSGRIKPQGQSEDAFWGELNRRISEGTVIPIISNSLISKSVFRLDEPEAGAGESFTGLEAVEGQISALWASNIGYPLPDGSELARVAQFKQVISEDSKQAKEDYLDFLKTMLLELAAVRGEEPELLEELRARARESSFSDLVSELDYLQFPGCPVNPLEILASLPLPIYVTTSYHDFLERALVKQYRKPRTQVCFWSGEALNIAREHEPDPKFKPSFAEPLVYHLLGLERYPASLVLGEDDYLDFLVKISKDLSASRKPIIPLYLREALTTSSLILLGYHLEDWDFRVLFRGLINAQPSSLRWFSLIIQLSPEEQYQIQNPGQARRYLEKYFNPTRFKVEWGNAELILNRLWQEWNRWRQAR
jgi:hypothetical protein